MEIKVKVVQYGCGPIECSVVRFASQRPDIELVGVIDIDKNLVGRDIGEVAGLNKKLGVSISDDADDVLSQNKPDVVFLTTSSSIKKIYSQIEQCAKAGANVVSTCEELSYPYRKDPKLAADIDEVAKVNPEMTPVKDELCLHLLQRGIATMGARFFVMSAAHTKEDVDRTIEAFGSFLDDMIAEGKVHEIN